jgi:hypothetical protein
MDTIGAKWEEIGAIRQEMAQLGRKWGIWAKLE